MTRKIDLGLVDGQLYFTEKDIKDIAKNAKDDIVSEVKAELDSCSEYEGYEDVLGLQVDYENKRFIRLAAAKGLEAGEDFDKFPMYGGMRRCNANDKGEIIAYYSDENFSGRNNGQVMVSVPKFYYKVVPLKLETIEEEGIGYHIRKANYYISSVKHTGFKLHPAFYNENENECDYFLYSAFEGGLQFNNVDCDDHEESEVPDIGDDMIIKIESRSGMKPISGRKLNLTLENAEQYCANRGVGWHCETIKSFSALQFLMIIEYGTMNLQNVLGQGVVNTSVISSDPQNFAVYTGSTLPLGNKSGIANFSTQVYYSSFFKKTVRHTFEEENKKSVSYRGIENPYGNLCKFVQGIYLENHYSNSVNKSFDEVRIAPAFNYDNEFDDNIYKFIDLRVNHYDGYISAMGYGNEKYDWLFFPSKTEGTSEFPVGDKDNSYTYSTKVIAAISVGGSNVAENGAGPFALDSVNYYSGKSSRFGCRLIYIPQN